MHLTFRILTALALRSLFFLSAALAAGAQPAVGARPNILFILADDMGYGDLGCYGATRIKTPNIDRLAAEGMRFTDAHAPGSVCVPSRYGLMTGRYPFRAHLRPNDGPVIEPGRTTLASLLKEHGYATGMIGKWHLGFEGGNSFDYAKSLRGGPVDRGFDSFFGVHASTDIPPYFFIENDRVPVPPTARVAASDTPGWSPVQDAFWREGPISPNLKLEQVLPTFTSKAVDWLEGHRARGAEKPFFLYVALTGPHTPWLPAEKFRGRSQAGLYGDFVAHVDDSVGRILDTLERAGLRDNTLVFFSSDNGPVWYEADRERLGHAAAGGFRGMKGDAWEGGHRMPFIARWPQHIQPGAVSGVTLSFTDMLATFAALVGAKLPDDAGEDSFSLVPALLGKAQPGPVREATLSLSSDGMLSLRQGDWKLIPGLGSGGFSKPAKVSAAPGEPGGQLYNLATDAAEKNNLWQKHPDVVKRLSALLEKYRSDGRSRPLEFPHRP